MEHDDALEPLMYWYHLTKRARWRHLSDVREGAPHADVAGACAVFHVAGNKYRLIAAIKYRWQVVCIRHILTHIDYGKGKWKQ